MTSLLSHNDIEKRLITKYGDQFLFIGFLPHLNQKKKLLLLLFCNRCKTFSLKNTSMLYKNVGCRECSRLNRIGSKMSAEGCLNRSGFREYTLESFVERARLVHGDRYEYVSLIKQKGKVKSCVIYRCRRCNRISIQRLQSHRIGIGCSCYSYEKKYGKLPYYLVK